MMIMMTRIMIVIAIMSMKIRARMHMASKCTKQSCSDKLWVENGTVCQFVSQHHEQSNLQMSQT